MLTIQTQAALTDAGFAPTATPDFIPTGAFVYDYTDARGDARRVEVTAAEDLDGYVKVTHYFNGAAQHPRVTEVYPDLFQQLAK